MKTLTTFSILFWLKQSKASNEKAPLYTRININGLRVEISLKIKIANWNAAKNRVKGTNQGARTINEYLNQLQKGIVQSKNELKEYKLK
jgi:integrase/recombinase XerD